MPRKQLLILLSDLLSIWSPVFLTLIALKSWSYRLVMVIQKQRPAFYSAYYCNDDDSSAVELEQLSHFADKSRIDILETTLLQRLLLCSSETSPEASAALYKVSVRKRLP